MILNLTDPLTVLALACVFLIWTLIVLTAMVCEKSILRPLVGWFFNLGLLVVGMSIGTLLMRLFN